jgi:hypothetical protein
LYPRIASYDRTTNVKKPKKKKKKKKKTDSMYQTVNDVHGETADGVGSGVGDGVGTLFVFIFDSSH